MTPTTDSPFQPADPQLFETALRRLDAENARDPNLEVVDGVPRPRELVYAQWLMDWLLRLAPTATEELRLAARGQHLCRWRVPRNSYPMTRAGYLRWREDLKRMHAVKTGAILREVGYPEQVIQRVQALIRKEGFPQDHDSRALEDALCLVFLEHQFAALTRKTTEEKMVNALKKAWQKMTPAARALAGSIAYGPREKEMLDKALSSV
jgi:Domain of unknown function (DUF4202)